MPTKLDVARWLSDIGIRYKGPIEYDGGQKFQVDCPFDENHKLPDAVIIQKPGRRPDYHCSHDSCAGNRWDQFLEQVGQPSFEYFSNENGEAPRRGRREREAPAFDFEEMTLKELLHKPITTEWLVEDILVADQPLLVGGPGKCMKTSITLDLMLSLVSGTPFLNRFAVVQTCPVFVCTGEQTEALMKQMCQALMFYKGVGEDVPLIWSPKVPQLSYDDHLRLLENKIRQYGARVAVIDPAYLSLLSAHNAGEAGNVFAMGSVLRAVGEAARNAGAMICLLHHFRKQTRQRSSVFEPAGLEDFAQSGFGEFARQWFLLQRRKPYKMGTFFHELYIQFGGSAGQSSDYALDIFEGDPKSLMGREWEPTLTPWALAETEELKREGTRQMEDDERRKTAILAAIATAGRPVSRTFLETQGGIDGGGIYRGTLVRLLNQLIAEERIAVSGPADRPVYGPKSFS